MDLTTVATFSVVVVIGWATWFLPNAIEKAIYRALLKFEAVKRGENPGGDMGEFSLRLQGAARESTTKR